LTVQFRSVPFSSVPDNDIETERAFIECLISSLR
jgi:hypothetical protein